MHREEWQNFLANDMEHERNRVISSIATDEIYYKEHNKELDKGLKIWYDVYVKIVYKIHLIEHIIMRRLMS